MTITWGEPPTGADRWTAIAEALRSRPGQWAQVENEIGNPKSYVTHIKTGRYRSFSPAGSFEAKVSRGQLWIRFVGSPEGDVDWPARFRTAGEVAERYDEDVLADALRRVAEGEDLDVVEAIGRALLGEAAE
jgi:hypothetical protein